MDVSSSQPSDSNSTVHGASSLLANLPSRGLLSSSVLSSNPGGMRVYICEHETSPPEGQNIKTNQQNILIRSLTLKKHKGDSSSRDAKSAAATDGPRKRASDRVVDSRAASKRANNQTDSQQEKDFHSLTVERLRALLIELGLSTKGRKDELVARLRNAAI
ncbi:uncharacterized protein LOC119985791 [Tripterygium wilfordii]|uniref:uncharacterized protein LOC119985791 n=1 Tax=Tripterygium wilfordii TaxID=458696 RepID=UPI0018F84815|nr:uncharacterized protein LOC119985791 [Tripterygium wilfordii]